MGKTMRLVRLMFAVTLSAMVLPIAPIAVASTPSSVTLSDCLIKYCADIQSSSNAAQTSQIPESSTPFLAVQFPGIPRSTSFCVLAESKSRIPQLAYSRSEPLQPPRQ